MPTFKIQHTTAYEYDRMIQESMNEIKIFPVISSDQEILQQELMITGNPELLYFYDYWNNKTANFNIFPPHQKLLLTAG